MLYWSINGLTNTQMTLPQETTMQAMVDYILSTMPGAIVAFIALILLVGYRWKRINIIIKIRGWKKGKKRNQCQ
jgi:hypothetical protein